MASTDRIQRLLDIAGPQVMGRAVTAVLFVSDNGDNTDGASWDQAYTTIQAALDAASTDVNECTLIVIGINTGPNNYDINTTGDPTWTGNYVLMGTHRTWQKIKNTHVTATSIMKFTGYVSLINLNFNLGSGSGNGVIITKGAFRIDRCQFVGEDLTGGATALHLDGAGTLKHGIVDGCGFLGEGTTHMTGILIDNTARSRFSDMRFHDCKTAIQVVGDVSDTNELCDLDIGDCGTGLDLDAGNVQHIDNILFHNCTTNIDDEVGDHYYTDLRGKLPVQLLPDDFTGVDLDTHADPDTWGGDTEILAAAGRTKPFRIVGMSLEADASEKFRIRLSADSGATHFIDVQVEGENIVAKRAVITLPPGTEDIFNQNTKISGSAKSESGSNTATIWLEVQEI